MGRGVAVRIKERKGVREWIKGIRRHEMEQKREVTVKWLIYRRRRQRVSDLQSRLHTHTGEPMIDVVTSNLVRELLHDE